MALPQTALKSELQVYNDIIGVIQSALTTIGATGWKIRQSAQPSIQGLVSPIVLVNYYDSKRYGWTTTNYVWDKKTQTGTGVIKWRKDALFQLTFWKDTSDTAKPTTDLQKYQTALDIATQVLSYFQSDYGMDKLAANGYFRTVAARLYNPDVINDSDKYTRTPIIRMRFTFEEQMAVDETPNFITKESESEAIKKALTPELYPITSQGK